MSHPRPSLQDEHPVFTTHTTAPQSLPSSHTSSLSSQSKFPPFWLQPGPPPPPRPNSDPRCNQVPISTSHLPRVNSSLIKDAWEFYLLDYPDKQFVTSLLHIIDHGASLGFTGPNHPQACRNLSSAFDAPDAVNTSIHSLRKNGHIHGPFPSPPLPNFRASPLGTVTRKQKTKRRLINHLSWPTGSSVNDGIPDSEAHIHYENFEQAIHLICSFGRGSLLAKLDLKDAFHHIPVRL